MSILRSDYIMMVLNNREGNKMRPEIKRISKERIEQRQRYNLARLYLWACEMMGIDPDNNPNYKEEN